MSLPKPPPPSPRNRVTLPPLPQLKDWRQVLVDCGYPERTIILDFESYFDEHYGLRDLSHVEYIADLRFEILGLASYELDDVHRPHFHVGTDAEAYVRMIDWNETTCIAHNCLFDMQIMAMKFGLHPKYIIDTVSLARHWQARSKHGVEYLAEKFGLPAKGKTADFGELTLRNDRIVRHPEMKKPPYRLKAASQERINALAEYALNDVRIEAELFKILLPRLSNPKVELRLIAHTVELATRPVLHVDLAAGDVLKAKMQAELDATIVASGQSKELISGNKHFDGLLSAALEGAGENPQHYYKPCKKGYMLAISKTDPEREKLLNHPSPTVRGLMLARVAVKSFPLHIARVDALLNMARANSGKLCVELKYYGALTGRYSGSSGTNLQNLPKEGMIAELRTLLIPPAGHKLVVVDAASIEARVLAWLAGDEKLCDAFRNNVDIYSDFASDFYQVEVRKPNESDSPEQAKELKRLRQMGKVAILGLGYGMGPSKFADFAKTDADIASAVVKFYRAKYPLIPRLWYSCEAAFRTALISREAVAGPRGTRFDPLGNVGVQMTLPNGRRLYYHYCRGGDGLEVWNDLEEKFEHIWGGTIVENMDQAISRDILTESMLAMEDAQLHVGLTVHDEVVSVLPDEIAERALEFAERQLALEPAWGKGLPLGAEGHVWERYGK